MPPPRRAQPTGPRPPRRPRVAGARGATMVPGGLGAAPTPTDEATPADEPTPAGNAAAGATPAGNAAAGVVEREAPTQQPEAEPSTVVRTKPDRTETIPLVEGATATQPEGTQPEGTQPEGTQPEGAPTRTRRRPRRMLVVSLAMAVLLAVFAVVASGEPGVDRTGRDNAALVDVAATDQAAAAAVEAVQRTYSYSFATIDQDLAAATALMTPAMAAEHEKNIATIKDAVAQAKTTSKAQVTANAVRTLQGDRAEVVAFVMVTSDNAGTALAPVSLRFTAQLQKVDGTWKLAQLTPS